MIRLFFGFTADNRKAEAERLDEREVVDRDHPLRIVVLTAPTPPLADPDQEQQRTETDLDPRGRDRRFSACLRSAGQRCENRRDHHDAHDPAGQKPRARAARPFREQHEDRRDDRYRGHSHNDGQR
jgi:hypothetical protein